MPRRSSYQIPPGKTTMTTTAPATTTLLSPTASCTAVVEASPRDVRELHELMRRGPHSGNENVHDDLRLNELTPRPWRYQHRLLGG